MPKTLAVRTIETRTAIVVVGPKTPDDEDWAVLVEAVKREAHDRTLVVSAGGGPSPRQRKAILEASGGKALPAAILTDSIVVRGIATAIAWFVPEVRAYPPHELQAALDHLKVKTPAATVQRVIDELEREMEDANRNTKAG